MGRRRARFIGSSSSNGSRMVGRILISFVFVCFMDRDKRSSRKTRQGGERAPTCHPPKATTPKKQTSILSFFPATQTDPTPADCLRYRKTRLPCSLQVLPHR